MNRFNQSFLLTTRQNFLTNIKYHAFTSCSLQNTVRSHALGSVSFHRYDEYLPSSSVQKFLTVFTKRSTFTTISTNITTVHSDEIQSDNRNYELASYAFAKFSPGRSEISLDEFIYVMKEMSLDFNLSTIELERVFFQMDTNGDGLLSLEEFKNGTNNNAFAANLVDLLMNVKENDELQKNNAHLFPDELFDGTISTAEHYKIPLDDGFVGDNISIRESLDYTYHTNYTHERQKFQDYLIRKNVLLHKGLRKSDIGHINTSQQSSNLINSRKPWLVHTCGPMGAGKGWVLGWMSANDLLPLEKVSKIDPDTFKLRMPEWPKLKKKGTKAGSLTHAESCYISEIAQNVAMNNDMDVWIDGSLRDYEWYKTNFQKIRQKWPNYNIAILSITAPNDLIKTRLKGRAKETGRHVPSRLQKASYRGTEKGILELTPYVDLIANISNDEPEPILKSVSIVDSSGDWNIIKKLTSS